ncbi:MAG TPA: hypothetical protein VFS25_12505 [Chitinophaga sp.]|uniref:hypothetical protein n=1 Tax=Chitinophaga sp. TaxID=1869181 RepID=UPI002DB8D55D|nr:hypothetical protein [Chitinophaga sp.]HEU4553654.1 hypothetical protein [Chitinophaga sp.]
MQHAPIANWIPFHLSHSKAYGWTVKWLNLGQQRMIHPFFDETIQVCRYRQKERSFIESLSTADFMPAACKNLASLEPTAFIFHVSRCGSTLLSQAFSAPEENIVVAEAPLLDEILRADEKGAAADVATRATWFHAALKLMGQKRNLQETAYIIKLDSWHIHFYDLLRQWFPQTPFFFLYREPAEVIASHEKRRGLHAVPGIISPALLKTAEPAYYKGDFNSYTANVLEQYYLELQRIYRLNAPRNYFFDYANGVKEMVTAFSTFSGIPIKNAGQVHERLQYHSKSPQTPFGPASCSNREKYFFKDCHAAYEQLRLLTL